MQIINHYKREVDKSIQVLREENIIAGNGFQESEESTELSRSSLMTEARSEHHDSELSQKEEQNPYDIAKTVVSFPKVSHCVVCHKQGKYRCPQCLISYCSSSHYKSHNLFCSQTFYKKQVQTQMKALKSTKQQQQQVRQMLKEDNLLKGEEMQLNVMTEERLMQLLEAIELCERDGTEAAEVVKLSEQESRRLEEFIKEVQEENNNERSGQRECRVPDLQRKALLQPTSEPYWQIPDGLDYYFMQQLQIEQFAQSANLSLIIYRESLAKRYREEIKPIQELTKSKVSPLVREDVLQYLIIWVLANLSWGGQLTDHQEIFDLVEALYVADLGREITGKGITHEEAGAYVIARLKYKMAALKSSQTKDLINSWYKVSAIFSCKLIVKNQYFLVETLLRLLEFFQTVEHKISSKDDKQNKKKLHHAIKHVKKLEFLLSYVKDQMQPKKDFPAQNPTDNMFRRIYRSLSQEEYSLQADSEQSKNFKNHKVHTEQIKKHGILIQQLN